MRSLPEGYAYKHISENIVRLKITTMKEVLDWIRKLQELTKETWMITQRRTSPGNGTERNLLRVLFHCNRKTSKNQNKTKSRNLNCPAVVDVTVKNLTAKIKTIINDDMLPDWPCIVLFKQTHNHELLCAENLSARPVGDEAKKKLMELFQRGHSTASAYHSYCQIMKEELGDDYEAKLVDRRYFPTKNDVQGLWYKHFKKDGKKTVQEMLVDIEKNLTSMEGVLFRVKQMDKNYAIAICTPLMQRAARLAQANEIMFVDGSGGCHIKHHKIHFFVTQTPAGGIPLGCILTSRQNIDVFSTAVRALYDILPIKISPAIILTDDDSKEINVLMEYWPNSTFLLCTYRVLKACRRWLTLTSSGVPREDAQHHYQLFRDILIADTADRLSNAKNNFHHLCKYVKFSQYVDNMLLRENLWCFYYRHMFITGGASDGSFIEVIFRLLKGVAIEKTRGFNITQLVDFIVQNFENYYKRRLIDLVIGRVTKMIWGRYLTKWENDSSDSTVSKSGDYEYKVVSHNDGSVHAVDILGNTCSCPLGYNENNCRHRTDVLKCDSTILSVNYLSQGDKKNIYEVACGKVPENGDLECPPIVSVDVVKELNLAAECSSSGSITAECFSPVSLTTEYFPPVSPAADYSSSSEREDRKIEVNPTKKQLDILKRKFKRFSDEIMENIDKDPSQYYPAVSAFLKNRYKYANSKEKLISGLHVMFKYSGPIKNRKFRAVRKGKKK